MKLGCDSCAKPAVGATAFHSRDGLVRVQCDECHGRKISPRISLNVPRLAVALWRTLPDALTQRQGRRRYHNLVR